MTNRFRDQCPLDCKVYVGELGNSGTRHEIEEAFGYYGPLRNVWVARNPPGFAFVMFEDPRDARDAVRALDGKVICGRRIKCELSTGKSRREGSRGFPSREGGRSYPPSSRGRGGSPRNGDSYRDREYPSHREASGYESGRDHHYRRYPEPRSRSRSFSPVNADHHHHRGSSKYGSSSLHGPAGSNGNGLTKHVPHHSRTPPSRSRSRSPVSKSPRSEARYH